MGSGEVAAGNKGLRYVVIEEADGWWSVHDADTGAPYAGGYRFKDQRHAAEYAVWCNQKVHRDAALQRDFSRLRQRHAARVPEASAASSA